MSQRALDPFIAEKNDFALQTKKGIGMPLAGMLFWIAAAVVVRSFEQTTALVFCFVLTGPVFPIGYALTKLFGGDLFAKNPNLTPLGIQLAALQLFYWPVIILVFNLIPEWTPLVMALLFGSHFLPYSWIYQSRAYAVLSISVALVLSVAAVVTRDPLYLWAPVLTAGCYALSVGVLWNEVRNLPASRNN